MLTCIPLQGLGPRRLDTAERNTLIDETVLFFDATSSSASQSRRAASVGPGATISHRDASIITPEAFEHGTRAALASSASRSASMVPSTRAFQDPGPSRQPAAVAGASARAPLMDAQRTVTAPATPPITGAPISESPSEQHNPPLYSPVPESTVSDTPDRLTGASVAVADAPRSPAPEPSLLPSPLSPRSHSQSLSSQPQNQVASSSASTDPSRPIPHEHFQDRAAELRAQALAMSPPSTPSGELSPAASRASSLYDRPLATHAPVQGGSTDNSRPPSVASSAETPETPATTFSRLRHHRESISTVDTPSTSEIPLSQTETNASMISLSSSSDHEGTSSLEEQRGRSQLPVNRNREREVLTNQTIMEDGPQEAYLDSLNGNHDQSVSPGPVSPRRPPLSVETAQASHAYSDGMGSTATGASQSSSVTPATGTRQGSGLPSSARRSSSAASSHTISSHTPKTARFSLSSLMHRDKSSSRTRRSASPESMLHGKRNHSTSRTRGNGLQAIKNALTGHHDKDGHMVTTHVTHTPISSEAESDSDDEHSRRGRSGSRSMKWQEFKAGSYNFPIYFPIPLSLPPTIHANHGQVTYMLKGFVNRAGALTTNLHTVTEVHVVAAPHEDDLEAIESIIVERMWETQLNYKIVIHCKVCFQSSVEGTNDRH